MSSRLKSLIRLRGSMQVSGLAIALALPQALPAQSVEPDSELVRAHYDMEVASYCSLVSQSVTDGFRIEVRRIMSERSLEQSDLELARTQAWKDAHEEWKNRGLGGFKGWCRGDAADSARRLSEISNQQSEKTH